MSKFLRDRYIKNISLNEDRLNKLNDVFLEIINSSNTDLPDTEEGENKVALLNYVIRFDNRGFTLDDFEKVIKYHNGSKNTERIVFILDNNQSHFSNAQYGKRIELRFDNKDQNNCILSVQDDDPDWVDSAYCKIEEELSKFGNKHYLIRNAWSPFVVQIVGVIFGFLISLWAALRISPMLNIEYSLIVSFILAFLIFSNIWTYLNKQILNALDYFYPNISFLDSKGLHWLSKSFLSALFVAAALFMLNEIFTYIGLLLNEIVIEKQ